MKQRLISSGHPSGNGHALTGVAIRKYRLDEVGTARPFAVDEPYELCQEWAYYDDHEQLLAADMDIYPFKRQTDVIVKGKARGNGHDGQLLAEVNVSSNRFPILVYGDREVQLRNGQLVFTDPAPLTDIPLRFDYAYGGQDVASVHRYAGSLTDEAQRKALLNPIDATVGAPFQYPRNPFGKGYIVSVDAHSFTPVALPNLEDPSNPLTPQNIVGIPWNEWYRRPFPRATDWVNFEAFPRLAFAGFQPVFAGDTTTAEELRAGWAPELIFSEPVHEVPAEFSSYFFNGAAPGLQFPYLQPGAAIQLVNIHPVKRDYLLHLPTEYPMIQVDGRKGKMLETKPQLHSVVIDTDLNELRLIWAGSAPALRPYHDEELLEMPLIVEWNQP
ncbi:MAG: DUF2169 domain-containing protein [Bacteroidota bacterium]